MNELDLVRAGDKVRLLRATRGMFIGEEVVGEAEVLRTTPARVVVKIGGMATYFRKADGKPGNRSSVMLRGYRIEAE